MDQKKLNIVIADDDADDQFFLIEAIKKNQAQHKLISVFDGSQLMDLLLKRGKYSDDAAELPDLILLDLNMPILDGFAALSAIKKNQLLRNIPIFILSTSRRENDKTACKLLGADEFYSKPTELHNLKTIVQEILDKAHPRKMSA